LKATRRRVWHISPEGFRELRHSCLLSRKRAADYLGVCVRTIRHWDTGRNRVPWSVVRLLRLVRAGELGGLDAAWEGWTINRHGLRSPCGRVYPVQAMAQWWLTVEQARFWREGYDLSVPGGVGAVAPAEGVERPPLSRTGSSAGSVGLRRETGLEVGSEGNTPSLSTALPVLPVHGDAPVEPAAGRAAGAAGRRPGAPRPLHREAATGGHDVTMTPECSHEPADGGGKLGACNMDQTASVSHSSLPDPVRGLVPWANRGPTNLNGGQSDVRLTPQQEPSCKGVA